MYWKENPVALFAKHMYTGHIVPLEMVRMGQTQYPIWEYDILVVELPRTYVGEMISHGDVKATFRHVSEAEQYIAKNYNFPKH